jgi:hypothetical protein
MVKPVSHNPQPSDPQQFEDFLLSRFLVDKNDNILGESIGFEGLNVVIKHKDKFYLIPRAAIKLKGGKLILIKNVDWVAAKAMGEGWRKQELDPLYGRKKGAVKKAVLKKRSA